MKIAIIGYSGSGKSTLAQALAVAYNAPALYLDQVHWLPGWVERPAAEEQGMVERFLDQQDSWVIDGNYPSLSYERRMAEADQIVFLNFSRWRCLARVARRYLENRGKTRLSMAADCLEKLDGEFIRWVLWDGRTRRKRDQYAALAARYPDKMVILRTPAQLDAFRRRSLAQRAAARRGR